MVGFDDSVDKVRNPKGRKIKRDNLMKIVGDNVIISSDAGVKRVSLTYVEGKGFYLDGKEQLPLRSVQRVYSDEKSVHLYSAGGAWQ